MAVRLSMAALIARVRLLINDPSGGSPIFADQDIQDVLDESRVDVVNQALKPTLSYGPAIQYLNYYSEYGGWEDDLVIKQYLTITVTPSVLEPIAGKFTFASTTYPPLFITGKQHDIYCAAADILERWAAKWALSYDFSSDSQSFKPSQAATALQNLAKTYRKKQQPRTISVKRSDLATGGKPSLGATEIDRIATGN